MLERNNSLEEEFALLGFDYKRMLETAIFVGSKYAFFTDKTRLNVNRAKHSYDEIQITLGVICKKKQPDSIHEMTVTLDRYKAHSYVGMNLYNNIYRPNEERLPPKEQICMEMEKILQIIEIREKFGIGDHPSIKTQQIQNAGRKPKL